MHSGLHAGRDMFKRYQQNGAALGRIPMLKIAVATLVASAMFVTPTAAASALYRCPLNTDIAADYSADAKSVTLYTQGMTFHLPIAMSGSGARYSDGRTTIWEHQSTATFETPGASFTGCKAIPLDR